MYILNFIVELNFSQFIDDGEKPYFNMFSDSTKLFFVFKHLPQRVNNNKLAEFDQNEREDPKISKNHKRHQKNN